MSASSEPADPARVAELHRLYGTLRDLDARIDAGRGGQTVAELREEYLTQYLALLSGWGVAGIAARPAAPSTPAPVAAAQRITRPLIQPAAQPAAPVAQSPTQAAPARPPRPAFNWQAFLADQAIAIMAYLGGFLLLLATLTFEVGVWRVFSDRLNLTVVCVVYLVFGTLGFALRRSIRLATVGRAYLGVFALMTPLVALAVYRFQLQATGFPASGMLCVAALYACVIYLLLALRTRFSTYAYLGWAALVVAALAVIPWAHLGYEWAGATLAVVALCQLAPARVRRAGISEALGRPALHLSIVVSVAAALGTEGPALVALLSRIFEGGGFPAVSVSAVVAATCALVALAAGWDLTLRRRTPRPAAALLDTFDVISAALAAQAVLAIVLWTGATRSQLASTLAALALAELGGAVILLRLWPSRGGVRRGVEGIALVLVVFAAPLASPDPAPNWPLAGALTVGVLVGIVIALAERAPWWLLTSGLALTLDYQVLGAAILPPSHLAQDSSGFYAALTLVVWAVGLALGLRTSARRYAAPVYVVALGDALYTTALLTLHPDAVYQTAVLLAFAVAAYVAARRERWLVLGGLVTGFYGILAALPFYLNDSSGWHGAVLAFCVAAVALALRRIYGRAWALAPYVAAVAAAVLAVLGAQVPGAATANLAPLDVPFPGCLLLAFAALAYLAAWWEDLPWAMVAPAGFALWSIVAIDQRPINLGLVFAIAAAGSAARQWRGRWWGVALYAAAVCGSVLVIKGLGDLGPAGRPWQVGLLLGYALAAYLVAVHERQPWATPAATLYVLAAVWFFPGTSTFVPTLAFTFGLAALGVVLSRLAGRVWALWAYAAAVGASVFAAIRFVPFDAGRVEALLLVFAATAYLIAALEREPWAAGASAVYAAVAVLLQPDAHALLPLALGLAVTGLAVGRAAGFRWSYPFYGAAAVAAIMTATLGASNVGFEALALVALAVAAYAIAAVESRPDVLLVALLLGVLSLAAGSQALRLDTWQSTLAFAALGWVYAIARYLWGQLPWLRARGVSWWTDAFERAERKARWSDPRYAGVQVHRWAAILVSGGTVVGALLAPGAFDVRSAQTQVVAVALLAFAGMLALLGRDLAFRFALYAAGELVALAITWEARWLGANNIQAFVLAPGSYQLLVGALLPADEHLHGKYVERMSQTASVVGALVLLVPTLAQSFGMETQWVYALALAVEALVIAGVGVGIHSRILVMVGSGFVGLAAIRGAILGVQSGLPVPLIIAALAILLMGAATWLSLRSRRGSQHATRP